MGCFGSHLCQSLHRTSIQSQDSYRASQVSCHLNWLSRGLLATMSTCSIFSDRNLSGVRMTSYGVISDGAACCSNDLIQSDVD
jgi:hypothetical protein